MSILRRLARGCVRRARDLAPRAILSFFSFFLLSVSLSFPSLLRRRATYIIVSAAPRRSAASASASASACIDATRPDRGEAKPRRLENAFQFAHRSPSSLLQVHLYIPPLSRRYVCVYVKRTHAHISHVRINKCIHALHTRARARHCHTWSTPSPRYISFLHHSARSRFLSSVICAYIYIYISLSQFFLLPSHTP